jgi:hypothetical protein
MKLLKRIQLLPFPIYPILFGIFPVLFLWNSNRAQEPAYVIIPSLLATLAGLVLIYVLAVLCIRNFQRAALVTLLISMVILSYGHIQNLLAGSLIAKFQPYLLTLVALLTLIFVVVLLIRRAGSEKLTVLLNLVSAALVVFQVITAAPYYLTMSAKASAPEKGVTPVSVLPTTLNGKPRDVYFILIDNYGRQDVLSKKDNFDNSELVSALKERGFIFPDCAQGNYFATAPVISSILNMNYLDQLGIADSVYTQRSGYTALAPLMQDSEVMRKFHAYGYHTVTFRGFMGLIDIQTSDTYINYESDQAYSRRLETKNFDALYFQTTLINSINAQYKIYPDWVKAKGPEFLKQYLPKEQPLEDRFYQVYQQNLYAYEALERIPTEIKGPKFVYAHIYSAHWPFMLQPDGSLRLPFTQEMTVDGYVAAVKYTNSRIVKAIDTVIKNSETPPVIILQGDHSDGWVGKVEWSGTDRMKILSAYYLPDGGEKMLRKDISPVNNFRLVFQYYFGEQLGLLPDVSHYLDPYTRTIKTAPSTCISESK